MSAKEKSKIKNNESKLAETIAIAGATEAATTEADAASTNVEHTPAPTESPVAKVATGDAASKLPVAVRARIATSKAVVSAFASARTAQAKAVQTSLAWIHATDARISKSLLVGEQFLLGRLRVTPE